MTDDNEDEIAFRFVAEWKDGEKELFRVTDTGHFEFAKGIQVSEAARKFAEFFNDWVNELNGEDEEEEPWRGD